MRKSGRLAGECARGDTPSASLALPETKQNETVERFSSSDSPAEKRKSPEFGRPAGRKPLPSLLPHNSSGIPRKTLSQKAAHEGSDWESGLGPSHADARPQVEQKNKDVKKVDGQ